MAERVCRQAQRRLRGLPHTDVGREAWDEEGIQPRRGASQCGWLLSDGTAGGSGNREGARAPMIRWALCVGSLFASSLSAQYVGAKACQGCHADKFAIQSK